MFDEENELCPVCGVKLIHKLIPITRAHLEPAEEWFECPKCKEEY